MLLIVKMRESLTVKDAALGFPPLRVPWHSSFLASVTKLIVYLFDKILNIRERIAPALTNRR